MKEHEFSYVPLKNGAGDAPYAKFIGLPIVSLTYVLVIVKQFFSDPNLN